MSKDKGKSYTQVMNEWAAQRSFLRRASTGLLRPGHGVSGGARVWGWIWRIGIMILMPVLFYMGVLRLHGKSGLFTKQLADETKLFLGAESVAFQRARWDMNGELRVELIRIKGSPENIFSSAEIHNCSTMIRVPSVFRPDWHLESVDSTKATVALRSGAAGKSAVTAVAPSEPGYLTAGWGLNPDGSKVAVNRYRSNELTLTWGGSPATSGELSASNVSVARTQGGWNFRAVGGGFRQCWLDRIRVGEARIQIGEGKAVIEKGDFMLPAGGSGTLTGSVTLGETPDISVAVELKGVQFHLLLPELFHSLVNAVCHGVITITGSTNRSTGIVMDTNLTVQSGGINGIPIFRALELATGETSLAQPDITAGHIHFISKGSEEAGGILIDADDVALDCGTRMKIGLTMRHERKQVLASTIRAALRETGSDSVALSTAGVLRIGLPAETAAKLKPSIRKEFLTREEQGYHWMEIPYRMEEGEFTKESADRLIALLYADN
jgi:hypothetical protein